MDQARAAHDHAQAPSHAQRIGFVEAISASWKIFCARWKKLVPLQLLGIVGPVVAFAPVVIVILGYVRQSAAATEAASGVWRPLLGAGGIAGIIFGLVVGLLLTSVVHLASHFVIADDAGTLTFGDSLRMGWKRLLSFWWISLLSGVVIMGGALLIVPAIIWAVSFSLAPWILVKEDARGMNSLLRARKWMKGDGLYAFWMFLGMGLVVWAITNLLQIPFGFISFGGAVENDIAQVITSNITGVIVSLVAGLVLTPLTLGFTYAFYKDLRHRKEHHLPELPKQKRYFTIAIVAGLLFMMGYFYLVSSLVYQARGTYEGLNVNTLNGQPVNFDELELPPEYKALRDLQEANRP